MKTIVINKSDLKKEIYTNAKVLIEEDNEQKINIDNELTDFLFFCFKAMRETKKSHDNTNTLGFISSIPKIITKESICLNITILKADLETMKENVIKFIVEALKQVNSSYYTIEEIFLNILENLDDSPNYNVETICNRIMKVGV